MCLSLDIDSGIISFYTDLVKPIAPQTIDTARLQLRMFQESDWDDLQEMFSDVDCVRHTIKTTLTRWQTWRTLAGYIGHWQMRGYGPYAVVEKSTEKTIPFRDEQAEIFAYSLRNDHRD